RGEVYPHTLPEEVGGVVPGYELSGVYDEPGKPPRYFNQEMELSKSPDTGIYSLNFYLGKRYSAGGVIAPEGGTAAAARRGFGPEDFQLHQNVDGQWFIKVKQAVTEVGNVAPVLRAADFPSLGRIFSLPEIIRSADNLLPEMLNQARITGALGQQK